MNRRQVDLAGALLSIGAIWTILSIVVAESLTPGYNVSTEAMSGLGVPYFSGICNTIAACVTPIQPASAVFVFSAFLNGTFLILSGYILRRVTSHRLFGLAVAVWGVAQFLVGVSYIPIYLGAVSAGSVYAARDLHAVVAYIIFVLPPTTAVSTYRFTKGPFKYFGVVLGVVALVALVLWRTGNDLGLGYGGMERMIVYPFELWAIGFGAYLMGGFELDSVTSSVPTSP
ncbi:MAG: hypothetical protein ACRD6W_05730 [Nitrososphaerales archaeon]